MIKKIHKKLPYIIFSLFVLAILIIVGYFYRLTISQTLQDIITTTKISKTAEQEKPINFIIGGDAMLGRAVAWKFGNDVTQAFTNLGENYFDGGSVGIINLEGPISETDFKANPTADNLIFNFPPQSIDALKYLGVKAVSLGNNHSQNQGQDGLETTRKLLEKNNIIPIGSQTKFNENSVKQFDKLSIITINLLETDSEISSTIKQEKEKGQFVLVFPHWGNEYQTTHSKSQEQIGRSWIDAGADIIIGSHPHVVQDAEIYNYKPIIYSLGNLVFDQSFSTQTQRGLIIKGEISSKNIKLTLLPTKISGYRVELLQGEEKGAVISKFKTELGENYFEGDSIKITI